MTRNLCPIKLSTVLGTLLLGLVLSSAWAEVTVSGETIEAKVRETLLANTPVEDPTVKVHVDAVRLPFRHVTLKGDDAEIMVEDTRRNPMSSRGLVQVTVVTNEDTRHFGVPCQLSFEKPVWVVRHFVGARQGIKPSDVMVQTKRLDESVSYVVPTSDNVTMLSSRMNLLPGMVLDMRNVTQLPLVGRNEDVRVSLQLPGGITVGIIGKALEDGTIGKKVRIAQTLSNNKTRTLIGEVVGKNNVAVKL